MQTFLIRYKTLLFLIILISIFLTGCWEFLSIKQPDLADPNSTFEVPITVGLTEEYGTGAGYFGIRLPAGWTASDSIDFNGVINGTFIYSKAHSDSMEKYENSPEGYYWRVCVCDTVDSIPSGSISFTPHITTDSQTGTFFIDYMISDRIEPFSGGRFSYVIHSGNYPISVNAPMTASVTNTNDDGPGSLRQAVKNVSSSGEILFKLSLPDSIVLDSQLVVDRNVTINGPESTELIVSVSDTARIFYVNENLKNVNISNLTISNGKGEYDGGGIYCAGSNLCLNNVTISNNSAGAGGGIWFGECYTGGSG